MRNVGSLMPWLLRPSLQKNVAGLGLRQGVLPLPPGVGWGEGRTAQVSEDLDGRGFLVLLATLPLCSHGEFPRRAQPSLLPPSDFVPGLDSPAWSDNLFLLFGDVGKS